MSVAKHVEITASSDKSFQDAVDSGLKTAGKTLKNITGAWIKDQKVTVGASGNSYRVTMKVTFVLA